MAMYLISIGKTSTGYSAHCPDVKGCATVGKTVEDVVANIKRSLALHFEATVEDGDLLPKPGGVKAYRAAMKDPDSDKYILAHVQIDTGRIASPVGPA